MSERTGLYFQHTPSSRNSRSAHAKSVVIAIQLFLIFAGLSVANASAQSAAVSIGSILCAPGQVKTLPITFTPGSVGVTMLQFDLSFPPGLTYSSLEAGSAVAPFKKVQGNSINGILRVVIFGTDNQAIETGVISNVQVGVMPGVSVASLPLKVSGIVASDASANMVGTIGHDGYVILSGAADGALPLISEVTASDITSTSATISWSTNRTADSRVHYGPTTGYGYGTSLGVFTTTHSVELSGLQPGTLYHYCVQSSDALGNIAISADFSFTTLSTEVSLASLAIPRLSVGQSWEETYVGIALINMDSETAILTYLPHDSNGNQLSSADNKDAGNTIQPMEQSLEIFENSLLGSASEGWIRADSTRSKISGFYSIFNESGTLLDGTTVAPISSTSFLFTEIEGGAYTRLNIINNNSEPVDLTIQIVKANGDIRSSVSQGINANGALVADLFRDLFPNIVPDHSDYIRVDATNVVQGFELLRKGTGDFAALPAQDLGSGASTLYSPQYVMGGIYRSTLSIVNLDPNPGTIQLKFIDKNGHLIGARSVDVAANGKIFISDPAFFNNLDLSTLTEGYVEINSDGIRLAGSVVFGDPNGSGYSTALPLVSDLKQELLFGQVASNAYYFTGYAVLNPNQSGSANVTFELRDTAGNLVDWQLKQVFPQRRQAWLLKEIFLSAENMANVSGYVRVTSDRPIAAFSTYGTTNMSAICVVPAQDIP